MLYARIKSIENTPTTCADPTMTATNTLSMIIADLLKVLQSTPTTSPVFNCQCDLSEALETLQTILIRDDTTQSVPITSNPIGKPTLAPKIKPVDPSYSKNIVWLSRSNPTNLYPIGTIICKKFNDGIFYEGAITSYNSLNNFYKVKFKNGNREEYTYDEV